MLDEVQPKSGKIPYTDWLIIALIGLLVQAIWLIRLEQPTYMDAYYYASNGTRLAEGEGFTEMVIWNYLDDPSGLPSPSHTYWMPVTSLIAAAGYMIRSDFLGQQLFFWILSGLLPLLAFRISLLLSGERWQAWVSALFTASGSFYGVFFSQPSTFTPYAWLGGLCLLMLGLIGVSSINDISSSKIGSSARKRRRVYWLLAGVFAGLAHLTRADGVILLIVGMGVWLLEIRIWRRFRTESESGKKTWNFYRQPAIDLILLIGGYLFILSGWLLRTWIVLDRPFSTVGFQSIFLTTYDDLFAYGRSMDLGSYLSWGLGNILRSKLEALWIGLQTLVAVSGIIFLVPFIIIALIHFYRKPAMRSLLRPAVWYAISLFLIMSLVFTFPGMRGAIFHSSSALWPWSTALAAAGIGLAVDWTASRLPHWRPEQAKRRFSVLFILLAFVLGLYISESRASSAPDPSVLQRVQHVLPADAVVMAGNAPAVYYHTDLPALSVPNEPLEIVLEAAARYGVTHILLDDDAPQPLREFYQGHILDPRIELLETVGETKIYQLAGIVE